jgi:hypothetical protein
MLIATGRLAVLRGHVAAASTSSSGVQVRIDDCGTSSDLPAGWLRDATGRPSTDMFTLGPLLRGRWYETTAIPEIRDQAAVLARVLFTSRALAGPGNTA